MAKQIPVEPLFFVVNSNATICSSTDAEVVRRGKKKRSKKMNIVCNRKSAEAELLTKSTCVQYTLCVCVASHRRDFYPISIK